jgi:hypothetical protein
MSRKKHTSKVELLQEVKEKLEEVFSLLEVADIGWNHLEHTDYVDLVSSPFEELLTNLDIFTANVDNGDYEAEDPIEGYEE